jgi:hypothetical protein
VQFICAYEEELVGTVVYEQFCKWSEIRFELELEVELSELERRAVIVTLSVIL